MFARTREAQREIDIYIADAQNDDQHVVMSLQDIQKLEIRSELVDKLEDYARAQGRTVLAVVDDLLAEAIPHDTSTLSERLPFHATLYRDNETGVGRPRVKCLRSDGCCMKSFMWRGMARCGCPPGPEASV